MALSCQVTSKFKRATDAKITHYHGYYFYTLCVRYCIWYHWKKPERKRKNLIRLGVEQGQAYAWGRSRMGGWAIAQSPILGTTITVEGLKQRGYIPLLDLYNQVKPDRVLFPMN